MSKIDELLKSCRPYLGEFTPDLYEADDVRELMLAAQQAVYAERNALAVAFARAALAAGWPAGRGHLPEDVDPQPDDPWPVVYVDLPGGQQVSWHVPPETPGARYLPVYRGEWDGAHTGRDPNWPLLAPLPAEHGCSRCGAISAKACNESGCFALEGAGYQAEQPTVKAPRELLERLLPILEPGAGACLTAYDWGHVAGAAADELRALLGGIAAPC